MVPSTNYKYCNNHDAMEQSLQGNIYLEMKLHFLHLNSHEFGLDLKICGFLRWWNVKHDVFEPVTAHLRKRLPLAKANHLRFSCLILSVWKWQFKEYSFWKCYCNLTTQFDNPIKLTGLSGVLLSPGWHLSRATLQLCTLETVASTSYSPFLLLCPVLWICVNSWTHTVNV